MLTTLLTIISYYTRVQMLKLKFWTHFYTAKEKQNYLENITIIRKNIIKILKI
jgi:hypothetical protein